MDNLLYYIWKATEPAADDSGAFDLDFWRSANHKEEEE